MIITFPMAFSPSSRHVQALALSPARAAPPQPCGGGTAAAATAGGPVGHRSAEAEPLRQARGVDG